MLTSILRGLQPPVQPPAPPPPAADPDPTPAAVVAVQDTATGQTASDNTGSGANSGSQQGRSAKPAPTRSAAMELAMTAPPGAASLAAAIKSQIEADPDDALAYARRLALAAQTRAQVEGYLDRMKPLVAPATADPTTEAAVPDRPATHVSPADHLNRRA